MTLKQCSTDKCERKEDPVQGHGACCIYCYIGEKNIHTPECDRVANK